MCGIGGAWGLDSSSFVQKMSQWLLHRGHEGVGYAYIKDGAITIGPPPEDVDGALVHTRYSTTGPYGAALQPVAARHRDLEVAVVFNGTVVNYKRLGVESPSFDGEAVAKALAREIWELGLEEGVTSLFRKIIGAASLLALTPWGLLAVRDLMGVRPLAVRNFYGGVAAASETVALGGGQELPPGVALIYGKKYATWRIYNSGVKLCALEYVYFAHRASELGGRLVYEVRKRLGEALADEESLDIDMVTYVPETARTAAESYAAKIGKPLVEAVVKSRYAGRIFITPPHSRSPADVFRVVKTDVAGRKVALVDDSLIRGTNIKTIIRLLREAGAREIHVRIASPPVKWPCFFGMDFQTRRELAAYGRDIEDVRLLVGADTLRYLPLEKFIEILGPPVCYGCFTGRYPIEIDVAWAEREIERS
ncbi:MAG: amidophosphoribosyltransferase [Pyrobaculum sp.]